MIFSILIGLAFLLRRLTKLSRCTDFDNFQRIKFIVLNRANLTSFNNAELYATSHIGHIINLPRLTVADF
jgi:hypothetical protein